MARSIPRQTLTRADLLRDLLESSYKQAVNIRGSGAEQALILLENMDRISELLPMLDAAGVDLRAERARWQEVQGALRRHGDDLRVELAPLGGLKSLRQVLVSFPSPDDRWWWWLDETAKRALRQRIFVTTAAIAGILLLIVGGVWAFNKLFPVAPSISMAYEHKANADNFIIDGDLRAAVTELEAAYQATPDDLEIQALIAVLYDLLGESDLAQPVLHAMYEAYPSSIVDINLAQAYVSTGAAEKALPLALQAVRKNPENPHGWLVMGMVYEARGDVQSAMDAYQRAAEKANAAQDYQTEAFAKVRLATLLQKPQLPSRSPIVLPTPAN